MSDCQKLGDCEDSRIERIYEYLDGALSPEDLKAIKEHLDSCPDCGEVYDVECVIRAALKRSCTEHAPNSLKDRILLNLHLARSTQDSAAAS